LILKIQETHQDLISKKREQERFKTQQIFIPVHPRNGLRLVPHMQ